MKAAARHLAHVGITLVSFLVLNWLNELAFIRLEQSAGINWVFLPAGIRLLSTLLFGLAGFEGLLLAGLYLNFHHSRSTATSAPGAAPSPVRWRPIWPRCSPGTGSTCGRA